MSGKTARKTAKKDCQENLPRRQMRRFGPSSGSCRIYSHDSPAAPSPPVPGTTAMTGHLIVTDEDAMRVITLRRPEKRNAITQEMYRAMSDAIDTAQNNPKIRCIIITGGSGVFTAGNDLEDFLAESSSSTGAPRASNAVKFLYSLAHNVKPIIAAVDGVAIGIGTTMLFHCDYVLASTTATFRTPFI